eukprot:1749458-Rhodomonas_salina.3
MRRILVLTPAYWRGVRWYQACLVVPGVVWYWSRGTDEGCGLYQAYEAEQKELNNALISKYETLVARKEQQAETKRQ